MNDLEEQLKKLANGDQIDNFDLEMAGLAKRMMEIIMEKERTGFLGYNRGIPIAARGEQRTNHRNGYYDREFLTSLGAIKDLKVPRDRLGEFSSQLVKAIGARSDQVDKLILSLYAKGVSTRDITEVIENIFGDTISPQTVSNITSAVKEEREAWEKRKLSSRYIAIFIDALFVKVRRDTVDNEAIYVIGAIDSQGQKEILGFYLGATESAIAWEQHLKDIKDRGVKEVLTVISDGFKGIAEAVSRQYPKAFYQRCLTHQMRNTLNQVRPKHKEEAADDFRSIYQVDTLEQAKANLEAVRVKWDKLYPKLTQSWEDNLEYLMAHLAFPRFLRKYLYTTNWLERVNKELRKPTKTKNSFPTEDSIKNVVYFKVLELNDKYESKRVPGFVKYRTQLTDLWSTRYPYSDLRQDW